MTNRIKYFISAMATLVVPITFVPNTSFAQSVPTIEEIIITARKKDETLQSAPLAVSAVDATQIQDMQMDSIYDIAMYTPGLSNSNAFGRSTERPVIRGLSNVLAGVRFGVESGAAYFIDGVYYPGDISSLNISDIQRVEVIRGPQSALYARNTYSGAINYITKTPGEGTSGSVSVKAGEHGERHINLSASHRFSENFATSISARDYEYDGEWTNLVTGKTVGAESSDSVSISLDYQNNHFSMNLRHTDSSDDDGTRALFLQPGTLNNCYPTASGADNYFCGEIKERPIALNDEASPLTSAEISALITSYADPALASTQWGLPTNSTSDGLAFSGIKRDVQLTILSMDYEMDNGITLSLSMGRKDEDKSSGSDSDHSPVNIVESYGGYGLKQANGQCYPFCDSGRQVTDDESYDFMIDSNQEQTFRWRIGYFKYDRKRVDRQLSLVSASNNLLDENSSIENTAVYGMIEYDFSDSLTWSLEGRDQEEDKSLVEYETDGSTQTGTWDSTTYRTTLNYTHDSSTLWYFTYSEGVKPGGFNGAMGVNQGVPTYATETNENIEIGLKKSWLDGRLMTNLALYQIDAENIQVTLPAPGTIGTQTSIVVGEGNLGEVDGIELELKYAINDNWDLAVNYSLADSAYTEGCDNYQWNLTSGGGSYNVDDPAASTNPNGQGTCSIAGKQFAFSPKTSYGMILSYNKALSSGTEVFGGVDTSYESKKYAQVHNGAYVGAYRLVNARLGFEFANNLTVVVYGKNLTDADEPVLVTRWLDNDYSRAFFANPRRSRNFGVEMRYDF